MRTEKLEQFYNSPAWRKVSAQYKKSKFYICEKCSNRRMANGKDRLKLICHHKNPLTDANVSDKSISLSYSNLQCLCIACHNSIHGNTDGTVPGLGFDAKGNLVRV